MVLKHVFGANNVFERKVLHDEKMRLFPIKKKCEGEPPLTGEETPSLSKALPGTGKRARSILCRESLKGDKFLKPNIRCEIKLVFKNFS